MQNAEAYIESGNPLPARNKETTARELGDLVSCRLTSLHRSAYRLLGNAADAEDAVQDALLAAYKHLDQFGGRSQMSTWLTTIVFNAARMQLRRRPRQIHVPLDAPIEGNRQHPVCERLADRGPTPEEEYRHSEMRTYLARYTTHLSPVLRKTYQLRELDGLSISETANILGVPQGTVKAQSARARAKLKRLVRRALKPLSRSAPYRR